MTQIGLNTQAGGYAPIDDHCADVRGPGAANAFQPVVCRKFIGEASGKVVRLSDIFRIPSAIDSQSAEDVNARNSIEHGPDRVVVKFVSGSAFPGPDEAVSGVDRKGE